MTEYTEQAQMVDALQHCARSGNCRACPNFKPNVFWHDCDPALKQAAADMIERLYAKTQEPQHELDEMIVEYEAEIRDLNRDIEDLEARVEELREELGYA